MKFIVKPRQGGKTHDLVDWYLEDPENRIIMTATHQEAVYIYDHYFRRLNMGFWEQFIGKVAISAAKAHDGLLRGHNLEIGIDNLDHVLSYLFGHIAVATLTDRNHTETNYLIK